MCNKNQVADAICGFFFPWYDSSVKWQQNAIEQMFTRADDGLILIANKSGGSRMWSLLTQTLSLSVMITAIASRIYWGECTAKEVPLSISDEHELNTPSLDTSIFEMMGDAPGSWQNKKDRSENQRLVSIGFVCTPAVLFGSPCWTPSKKKMNEMRNAFAHRGKNLPHCSLHMRQRACWQFTLGWLCVIQIYKSNLTIYVNSGILL